MVTTAHERSARSWPYRYRKFRERRHCNSSGNGWHSETMRGHSKQCAPARRACHTRAAQYHRTAATREAAPSDESPVVSGMADGLGRTRNAALGKVRLLDNCIFEPVHRSLHKGTVWRTSLRQSQG